MINNKSVILGIVSSFATMQLCSNDTELTAFIFILVIKIKCAVVCFNTN